MKRGFLSRQWAVGTLAALGLGAMACSTTNSDPSEAQGPADAGDAQKENPDWGIVTIEGHCDERGNEEYNLALGERRASAVKQYLSDLGVSEDRLKTRSYGEMEPTSLGHSELAWRLNRRAQFEIGD